MTGACSTSATSRPVLTQPWTNFVHIIKPSTLTLEESPICREDDAHRLVNLDHHSQR